VTNGEFACAPARILQRSTFLTVPVLVLRLAMGEVAEAIVGGDAKVRRRSSPQRDFSSFARISRAPG
jgi:NAD dependent epimerase/dehydratase family enzyme